MNELAKIDSFKREVAVAETIAEVQLLTTKGEILAEMAKKLKIPLKGQNALGRTRTELEKKKRELIEVMFPKGGDRGNQHTGGKVGTDDLASFGITKDESSDAKIIAEEEELVQEIMEEIEAANEVITPKLVASKVRKKRKRKIVNDRESQYKEEIKSINNFNINIYETDKKFNIIYADPAWQYWEGGDKNQSLHYHTMTIDAIGRLPIKKIADENCILFLWVTFPILEDCFKVINAWGFKYSTCGFVWVKRNKYSDTWFFGNGSWTRANSELCLIATKGSVTRINASISQIIDERIGEHSEKPVMVRKLITELVGELPRIELFSRYKDDKSGWFNWGNEL